MMNKNLTVDLSEILTEDSKNNPAINLLYKCISEVWQEVVSDKIAELEDFRDFNNKNPEILNNNAIALGLDYPADSPLTEAEYRRLASVVNKYSANFKGLKFSNVLSYIYRVQFATVPLWAKGVNQYWNGNLETREQKYNSLYAESQEIKDNSILTGKGPWYPTSHFDIEYSSTDTQISDLSFDSLYYILKKLMPINMVIRYIYKKYTVTPKPNPGDGSGSLVGKDVIDNDGNIIGKVDNDGVTVVDKDGNVIGKVDSDGKTVIDENGNVIGKVDESSPGTTFENPGSTITISINSDYNKQYVKNKSVVTEMTMAKWTELLASSAHVERDSVRIHDSSVVSLRTMLNSNEDALKDLILQLLFSRDSTATMPGNPDLDVAKNVLRRNSLGFFLEPSAYNILNTAMIFPKYSYTILPGVYTFTAINGSFNLYIDGSFTPVAVTNGSKTFTCEKSSVIVETVSSNENTKYQMEKGSVASTYTKKSRESDILTFNLNKGQAVAIVYAETYLGNNIGKTLLSAPGVTVKLLDEHTLMIPGVGNIENFNGVLSFGIKNYLGANWLYINNTRVIVSDQLQLISKEWAGYIKDLILFR